MFKLRVEMTMQKLGGWLCKQLTFTKLVVAYLLWKSVGWIDQSYALAWAGRTEIAESLSKVALTEVIAVFALYAIKSLFTSLSEHNTWPDKPLPQTEEPDLSRDC